MAKRLDVRIPVDTRAPLEADSWTLGDLVAERQSDETAALHEEISDWLEDPEFEEQIRSHDPETEIVPAKKSGGFLA